MLIAALYASDTGLQAASNYLDAISNNVANSSTPGFKTEQVSFQDLLYSQFSAGAAKSGGSSPGGIQLGSGAVLSATSGLFTQGTLTPSGGPFDVAINGQGFFAVTRPDGTTAYTRAGSFTVNSNGQLVLSDGSVLAGGITVPANTSALAVSSAGLVTATTPTGVQQLGQLQIALFPNPGGLSRVGDTEFAATAAAGTAVVGVPGTSGLGTLSQGFLEGSNVDLPTELTNLVIAQQSFVYNTQALTVESQTLQDTTSLIT
jgi:flagellar basal-body rod protein FlgG